VELLDDATVDAELAAGIAWERQGHELTKTVRSGGFVGALAYVNAVGAVAEELDHHPDIDIRFNVVTLRVSTHSAGGLTAKDLELARRVDALASSGG
jgi:4a-hydroxytetrahydrobiopterin dehydratase